MRPLLGISFISLPILLLLLLVPFLPPPCKCPAIFNLGDSNSDTGGLSASFGPVPPPYGQTFFNMPAGRYSDGRLIIDFIAESLGLPHLSAYLDAIGADFSHGANFATRSSTIIPQNVTIPRSWVSPFSLEVQFGQFSQFKSRSQVVYKKGGLFKRLLPKEAYFSEALYTIDMGQNDLTTGYFANKSSDEYIPEAMNRISATVKSLYHLGGRYFWIHNTGPLGCLPYVLLRIPLAAAQLDSIGCENIFNELAKQFNMMLNETVAQLRRELHDATFIYVDVYTAKYTLFSQAKKYGFDHSLRVCCGYGGGEYNFDLSKLCGYSSKADSNEVMLGRSCKDPAKYIVWDGVHYTEAANKWVFDQISGGAFSDPPVPLSMACRRQVQ